MSCSFFSVAYGRGFTRRLGLLLALCGILTTHLAAHAAIIVEEQFAYGGTNGALAGNNGGTGFSTAWADHTTSSPGIFWTYEASGLTFGSLVTSGGAARWSNLSTDPSNNQNGQANRQLTTSLSSTVFGSFLFRVDRRDTDSTAALIIGAQTDGDSSASFAVSTPQFGNAGTTYQVAERINGQESNFFTDNGGVGLTKGNGTVGSGTTYLALFAYDPTGASSQGWVLSADQFATFQGSNTLTPTDLNSATLGSGASEVLQRGGLTNTTGVNDYLGLFGTFEALDVTYDEIRISNTSLAEVAPVPEPSTFALAAGALALSGLAYRRHRHRRHMAAFAADAGLS